MKKYIVVTGGSGFIGSNMIQHLLLKTNKNIVSLDNYSTGLKKNHIKNRRVKYIKADTKDISNKLKLNIKIYKYLSKPDGTIRKIVDISIAKKYGWKSRVSLNDGFDKTYSDYKNKL